VSKTPRNKSSKEIPNVSDGYPRHNMIMQLFEKGLLSRETVLVALGYNPEQEKVKQNIEAKECLSQNRSQPSSNDVLSMKIEHARRNVEVLCRVITIVDDKSKFLALQIFNDNLDILSEVKNFK